MTGSLPHKRRALGFHGLHMHYAADWEDKLASLGINRNGDWRFLDIGEQVSNSPLTKCFRITINTGEVIYFKRYNYSRIKPQFYYPWPSKAAVENFGFHQLKTIGIPTLEVLAFGEQRNFGNLRAAFIVTRGIPDSTNLEEFARSWYRLPEPEFSDVYHELSRQILEQARTAHQKHFSHHDLKWRNIVIQQTAQGYLPVWIDCPRASYMHVRRRRGQLVDLAGLARLAISYLDVRSQLKALRFYLDEQYSHGDARQLYREIQHYLSRRLPEKLDIGEKRVISHRPVKPGS